MKKTVLCIITIFVILISVICFVGCNDTTDEGVETPPVSDGNNNAQEPAEVQDPGYSRIEYKLINVYDTENPFNDTPIPGVGAEDAYPRERYYKFMPFYTSDYEIATRIGEKGTITINNTVYESNGGEGHTKIKLRMEAGEWQYIDIKLGEDFKAYRFAFGIFTHTGFDNVTIAPGEQYVVRVASEEAGVKRYISQNPAIVFHSLKKLDKDVGGKYVTDSHFSGANMSLRLDVYFGSVQKDNFKYIIFENVSDTEQTLDVTEEEIESVNLNEEFEIDWKSGESYYFVKYEETDIGTSYKMRTINLSTSEFGIHVIAAQGSTSGYTARPGVYFLPVIDGIYYIGFMFNPENTYTITIQ